MREVLEVHGLPEELVQVALPLNTRGQSIPIVHCVRHRRTRQAEDQYAGTQQNMNQEYINLTRGVEKTCMWVEIQPFGYPGKIAGPLQKHHGYGSCPTQGPEYAWKRMYYIKKPLEVGNPEGKQRHGK